MQCEITSLTSMLSRSAARRIGKLSLYSHNKSSSSSIHHTKKTTREKHLLCLFLAVIHFTLFSSWILSLLSHHSFMFNCSPHLHRHPPDKCSQALNGLTTMTCHLIKGVEKGRASELDWTGTIIIIAYVAKEVKNVLARYPPTTSTPIESWFNNEVHVAHSETR